MDQERQERIRYYGFAFFVGILLAAVLFGMTMGLIGGLLPARRWVAGSGPRLVLVTRGAAGITKPSADSGMMMVATAMPRKP